MTRRADNLPDLLLRAEAGAARPATPAADWTEGVIRRANRLRTRQNVLRRIASLATAAALLLAIGQVIRRPPPLHSEAADIAAAGRASDALQADIDFQSRLVAAFVEVEKRERAAAAPNPLPAIYPDPRRLAERELDRAAATLVAAADRTLRDPLLSSLATERYAAVAHQFHETQWASVAASRLTLTEKRP